MEIEQKKRKTPKRIVFNINEEDHEIIKHMAAAQRITMRTWIINALDKAVKIQQGVL